MRLGDPAAAVAAARGGNRRALGQLLTAVEQRAPAAAEISRLTATPASRVQVVGITGPPGVGKSTTSAALVRGWRALGRTVAVIAVDPSSPFTGGALLGDRIRMTEHTTDPGVFIRSMAARGRLGGLAAATPAAVRVLAGCGFDLVLVETVGVGQSEVDIVRYADTVVILQAPGMGDQIQASKAGLLEIADVLVVNKADRPEAAGTARELRAMVRAKPLPGQAWRPPVLRISAADGTGVDALLTSIDDHHRAGLADGSLAARRRARAGAELVGLATERFTAAVTRQDDRLDALAADVVAARIDPYAAAAALTEAVLTGGLR